MNKELSPEDVQKRIDAPCASTWEREYWEDYETHQQGNHVSTWDYLVSDMDDLVDSLTKNAGG